MLKAGLAADRKEARDCLDTIREGQLPFASDTKTYKELYKSVAIISDVCPEFSEEALMEVSAVSTKQNNDADNIKLVFDVCNKIAMNDPKMSELATKVKTDAFKNLCMDRPEQGLLVIADCVGNGYPDKNTLYIMYSGMQAMLSSTKLKKKSYEPWVKLLTECAKSGYNEEENAVKLKWICDDIYKKAPEFNTNTLPVRAKAQTRKELYSRMRNGGNTI